MKTKPGNSGANGPVCDRRLEFDEVVGAARLAHMACRIISTTRLAQVAHRIVSTTDMACRIISTARLAHMARTII
jgi:hypothetical protein